MWRSKGRVSLVIAVLAVMAVVVSATPTAAVAPVETVTSFDEPSEGVTVDKKGNVFVSLALSGKLLKFDRGSDEYEEFGAIDGWETRFGPLGAGFLGLTVDKRGNVYGAAQWVGSTGVYKFHRKTGKATLIPGTEAISFPNSLVFDKKGSLYVTDTNSTGVMNPLGPDDVPLGAVWRIGRDGTVEKWLEDVALGGNGAADLATPLGANGIDIRKRTLYVANSEKSQILSIRIRKNGKPGKMSVYANLPLMSGSSVAPPEIAIPVIPDGIAIDGSGAIYVAAIVHNAILRVNTSGSTDIIAHDLDRSVLDFPSSLAFDHRHGKKRTLYSVNLALGPPGAAGPALTVIKDVRFGRHGHHHERHHDD